MHLQLALWSAFFWLMSTFSLNLFPQTRLLNLPFSLACSTAWAAQRSEYKRYRALLREIPKRYRQAKKRGYSEPCRAFFRIQAFLRWNKRRASQLETLFSSRYKKRRLRRRFRAYRRYASRRLKRYRRRCERYWKKELKRRPSFLRKNCRHLEQGSAPHHYLRIGVRPWAYVYINGKLCGTAPLIAYLPEKTYQIRLSYPPGHDSFTTQIQLFDKDHYLFRFMQKRPSGNKKWKGLLTRQQLRWVISKNLSTLRSCSIYEMAVKRVIFSWDIDRNGIPKNVQLIQPIGASKRFRQCVTRAITRWRFPKLKGGAKIRSYPIQLYPNK